MQSALPGSAMKSHFLALPRLIDGSRQGPSVRCIWTCDFAPPARMRILRAVQPLTFLIVPCSSFSFTFLVPARRKRMTFFLVSCLRPAS